MTTMTPVPADHPLMRAWEAHKLTDAYSNSRRWAMSDPKHVDGALWALFVAGWEAASAVEALEAAASPAPTGAVTRCEECGDQVPKHECFCRENCVHAGVAYPASPAPAAAREEPVAWMWQHAETGNTGFIEHCTAEERKEWERMNKPRNVIAPLFSRPQAPLLPEAVPEETLLNAQRYEELREHLVDCTRSDDGTTWFCSLSGDELDSEIDASIASMSASPTGGGTPVDGGA